MIAPFGLLDQIDPTQSHILLYPRVSDDKQEGNDSTDYQGNSFPTLVEQVFGIDRLLHQKRFEVADVEVESAGDTGTRLTRNGAREVTMSGFARTSFLDIIFRARDLYEKDTSPVIIGASSLSRIGRSVETCMFLEAIGREMDGNLRIWTPDSGRLLNPNHQADFNQILMMIGVVNKGELDAKRQAVTVVRNNIASQTGQRCLGERPFGYEQYYCFPDLRFEAIPPEILGTIRKKWSAHRTNDSEALIVREINRLAREGMHPSHIVQTLNETHGPNPRTDSPWHTKLILRIMRDSIYRGVKRLRKTVIKGGKRRRKAREGEVKDCPPCEALRILTDDEWYAAREMLRQHVREEENRKNRGGTYSDMEALFYRTDLLRCALCGGRVEALNYRRVKAYACRNRSRLYGQPRCQHHQTAVVDEPVNAALRHMFSQVKAYETTARQELQESLDDSKRRKLKAQVEDLTTKYEENLQGYPAIMAKFAEDHPRRMAIDGLLEKQEREIDKLQKSLQAFDNNPRVTRQRTMIALISGMEAFEQSPIPTRRALIKRLMEAVWLWPDGQIVVQWKGESLDDVSSRSDHPLLLAQHWPIVNFALLAASLVQLIVRGEIPIKAFEEENYLFAGGRRSLSKLVAGTAEVGKLHRLTLLIGYYAAQQLYLDMPQLREDITGRMMADLSAGLTRTDIVRATGLSLSSITKIVRGDGSAISRFVWERAAGGYGIDLDPYRVVPTDIYQIEMLEEMVTWLTISGSDDEGDGGEGADTSSGQNPPTGDPASPRTCSGTPTPIYKPTLQPAVLEQLVELLKAA